MGLFKIENASKGNNAVGSPGLVGLTWTTGRGCVLLRHLHICVPFRYVCLGQAYKAGLSNRADRHVEGSRLLKATQATWGARPTACTWCCCAGLDWASQSATSPQEVHHLS